MTPFRTIKLAYPLVTASGVVTEVTIRRPRAQDVALFARIDRTKPDAIAKMSALVEALSGLPAASVEDLDFEDFATIAEATSQSVASLEGIVSQSRHKGRRR